MLALLTALALTLPNGPSDTMGADGDFAKGGSSMEGDALAFYAEDPPEDPPPEDPPPEDPPEEPPEDPPPPENEPPAITSFSASIDLDTLWVEGTATDEDLASVTVRIEWLDEIYEVDVDSFGDFHWYIELEDGDEGWVSAVAFDSDGLVSEMVQDLVLY